MATFLRPALLNWTDAPIDSSAINAGARRGFCFAERAKPKHTFIFPRVKLTYNGEYESFFQHGRPRRPGLRQ